jgi:hypothetical protein
MYASLEAWKSKMKEKFRFFRTKGSTAGKMINRWPYDRCSFSVTIEYRVYDPVLDNTY